MQFFYITLLFAGAIIIIWYIFARTAYRKRTVSEVISKPVILKISVPANNDKKPQAVEQFLQAMHGTLGSKQLSNTPFSFEIVGNQSGVYFLIACESRFKTFIENQIYAQYPDAQVTQIQDYATPEKQSKIIKGFELGLKKDFFLPIKTFTSFEVDPLASIVSTMNNLKHSDEIYIQVVTRPIADNWQELGKSYVNKRRALTDEEGKKVGLTSGEGAELSQVEYKNQKSGFQFVIRVIVRGTDSEQVDRYSEDVQASFNQFQTAQFNALSIKKYNSSVFNKLLYGNLLADSLSILEKYQQRFLSELEQDIVNTEELASLYHLPSRAVQSPNISWAKSRKIEPPQNLPKQNARIFGLTDYRDQHFPFGIKKEDRRRHMYLLGKTGTGKSMFIKNMVYGDLQEGEGLCIVDPHGELIDDVLTFIPEHRLKDVVLLDPSDVENPIGLNMLDIKEGESKELLADGIVSVFIKLFGNSCGPRLQYILTNTVLTLLHCQNVSLLAVNRILLDKNYRKFLLKQVDDPFLLKFWNEEYEQMSKNQKLLAETLSPIQNKVGRFLSSPLVRNMIGQVKSSIDLREIMDDGKILLINLSQGKIGEENTSLLGGMIITRLYTNAMQRANVASDQRKDFYLYVDEFQNFATDTFVKILSEARKYGLNLLVTHQFVDQIQPNIQDAIFGNVGTLINYVVGPKDAQRLEKEFAPSLTADDLVNLERFSFAIKMMIDGAQSAPFTGKLLIPSYPPTGIREQIKDYSRQSYSTPRDVVESKLNKWANQEYDDKGNLVQNK
ncbi:ATP-binding protein [Candidatus Dojkabacteria bacterium]|uniref:ATP-binding protein n=1 Tax=Candidatus Dojkabacteria bacterium TaxID=2099670 RepID=A0A955I9E5_9BACT|nr:ATP-binding protein [Candidatus Dojkabacteria bacterium]